MRLQGQPDAALTVILRAIMEWTPNLKIHDVIADEAIKIREI